MEKELRNEYSSEDALMLAARAVGDIFKLVGLKPAIGRIWAILYLSKSPMDVHMIRAALKISTGATSMGLNELMEMGLVHRDTLIGKRQFFYRAETEMWQLVKRIFRDRERVKLISPLEKLKQAEQILTASPLSSKDDESMHHLEQLRHLVGLGSFVVDLLDAFMERTKVEVKAAQKWLSMSGKLGGEPLSRLRRRINALKNQ